MSEVNLCVCGDPPPFAWEEFPSPGPPGSSPTVRRVFAVAAALLVLTSGCSAVREQGGSRKAGISADRTRPTSSSAAATRPDQDGGSRPAQATPSDSVERPRATGSPQLAPAAGTYVYQWNSGERSASSSWTVESVGTPGGATRQRVRYSPTRAEVYDWTAGAQRFVSYVTKTEEGDRTCSWNPQPEPLRFPLAGDKTWSSYSECTSDAKEGDANQVARAEECRVGGSGTHRTRAREIDGVWVECEVTTRRRVPSSDVSIVGGSPEMTNKSVRRILIDPASRVILKMEDYTSARTNLGAEGGVHEARNVWVLLSGPDPQ